MTLLLKVQDRKSLTTPNRSDIHAVQNTNEAADETASEGAGTWRTREEHEKDQVIAVSCQNAMGKRCEKHVKPLTFLPIRQSRRAMDAVHRTDIGTSIFF